MGRASRAAILIVDDDPRIRVMLRQVLERAGYAVRLAVDAVEAERAVLEALPQLVLLDVSLPRGSGPDLLRGWRARGLQVPVVMLTAHGGAEREASLLEAGADDFIDKPVQARVLVARVATVLRRAGAATGGTASAGGATAATGAGTANTTQASALYAGPLILHVRERLLVVHDRRVTLTRTETALLRELLQAPGVVRPYDDLLTRVWGPATVGQTELLHTNVYRLRRKLEADPSHPVLLVATAGVGYCLLPDLDRPR
ncbi:MAG: response regulator transcription factor [Chloroflexota bacterium]